MRSTTKPRKYHAGMVVADIRPNHPARRLEAEAGVDVNGSLVWWTTNPYTDAAEMVRVYTRKGMLAPVFDLVNPMRVIASSVAATYTSWRGSINRCYRPSNPSYRFYGGRGVKVYDPWTPAYYGPHESAHACVAAFRVFLAFLGPKPAGCDLDRIDPHGNYEPGNVRWAPPQDGARRRRTVRAGKFSRPAVE